MRLLFTFLIGMFLSLGAVAQSSTITLSVESTVSFDEPLPEWERAEIECVGLDPENLYLFIYKIIFPERWKEYRLAVKVDRYVYPAFPVEELKRHDLQDGEDVTLSVEGYTVYREGDEWFMRWQFSNTLGDQATCEEHQLPDTRYRAIYFYK